MFSVKMPPEKCAEVTDPYAGMFQQNSRPPDDSTVAVEEKDERFAAEVLGDTITEVFEGAIITMKMYPF